MGFNKDSLTDTRRFGGIKGVVHTRRSEECIMPSTPKGHFSTSAGMASVLCNYCTTTRGNRSFARGLTTVGSECRRVVGKLNLGFSLSRSFRIVHGGFTRGTKDGCTTSEKRFLGNGVVTTCLKFRFVSTTRIIHFSRGKSFRSRVAGRVVSTQLRGTGGTIVPKFCKTARRKHMIAFSENNSSVANSLMTHTIGTSLCRG